MSTEPQQDTEAEQPEPPPITTWEQFELAFRNGTLQDLRLDSPWVKPHTGVKADKVRAVCSVRMRIQVESAVSWATCTRELEAADLDALLEAARLWLSVEMEALAGRAAQAHRRNAIGNTGLVGANGNRLQRLQG